MAAKAVIMVLAVRRESISQLGQGEVPEAKVLMERLALTESVRGLREP